MSMEAVPAVSAAFIMLVDNSELLFKDDSSK